LAVADFWRVSQQRAADSDSDAAGRRLGECRAQAGEVIGTLLDSGALTPLGARFVQQMRNSLATLTGPATTGHSG
jgi:HEXXH motif-containing protein